MNNYFSDMTQKINEALVRGLDPGKGVLEAAMHYALTAGGKRLRPMLFLSLIEACGVSPDPYMEIACAIECIHTYSLIHDDLPCMDNDDFRRGVPTVHKKFNDAIALLAGDTLLTYAFERVADSGVEPRKTVNILKILTAGIGKDGMAGGQILDLGFAGDQSAIPEIHRKKTAELIKACFLCAAEVLDLDPDKKEKLAQAAVAIGVAFQMTDDLLDVEGDEALVGKPLQKDARNQSPNSVLYFGKEFVQNEITALYRKTSDLLRELDITFPPFLQLMDKMVYRSK